ncbi:hypothetical protein J4H92_03170 [Leucobacter weissii]|uniref:Uncharacterized protein n=1 Tax=Leucobacter weissii TaxID=1983706 RepID=A0A939MHC9_9MICO|nr:hypothetical protein [Leucobacter weissii]MBO1900948.1 hypothetical protein [Leucobacter weissii]
MGGRPDLLIGRLFAHEGAPGIDRGALVRCWAPSAAQAVLVLGAVLLGMSNRASAR